MLFTFSYINISSLLSDFIVASSLVTAATAERLAIVALTAPIRPAGTARPKVSRTKSPLLFRNIFIPCTIYIILVGYMVEKS